MTSSIRFPLLLAWLLLAAVATPAIAATFVVNSAAAEGGDGSPERPFRTLAEADAAGGAGDAIVVVRGSGPYNQGITLERGQSLSASTEPATDALPVIRVSEGHAIEAGDAADLTIRDMAIELSGNASGIVLNGVTGTIAIRGTSITGTTTGNAIDIQRGDAAIEIDALSLSGSDRGIALDNLTGTFVLGGSTIRDVRKRGLSVVHTRGVTLRDTKFINVPSANAASASTCGTPGASGQHLACGAALHLQNAEGITLERVSIADAKQVAVTGDAVRDLTMTAVEIRGAGDENNEHGVQLRNVSGKVRIDGSRFDGPEGRHLYFAQDRGEVAIAIHDTTFRGAAPPNGQQGVLLQASGDARVQIGVDASTFTDNFGNAVQLIAEGKSVVTAEVSGSTFRKNAAAVTASASDDASLRYRITKNKIEQSSASALNIHATTRDTASGEISDNTVNGAACGGGCSGISVTALGRGTSTIIVSRNTVERADANGIFARAAGDATLHVRIAGNTIRQPAGPDALYAILIASGTRKADRAAVCAELGGAGELLNTISGSWNRAGGGAAIRLARVGEATSLGVAQYAGDRTNAEGLSKFVAGRNRGAMVEADIADGVRLTDGCTTGEH